MDGQPNQGEAESGGTSDRSGETGDGDVDDPIGLLPNLDVNYLRSNKWEVEKIDDSQLKPCMKTIMNDVKSLSQGVGQIVAQFAGNTPGYNWEIKDGSLSAGSNAVTSTNYNSSSFTVTTTFDSNKFGSSTDLSIVRTILHEAIHAHIVTIAKGGLTIEEQNHVYGDNWIIVFVRENHPYIASEFVSGIALSLQQFGNLKGYDLPQQFYSDLAWGGLTNYDLDGDGQYELTPWFMEAYPKSSDRNRILNVVKSEQEGYSSSNGSDAGC